MRQNEPLMPNDKLKMIKAWILSPTLTKISQTRNYKRVPSAEQGREDFRQSCVTFSHRSVTPHFGLSFPTVHPDLLIKKPTKQKNPPR